MSIKSKVLAAATTLTLVSGVGMAGALTAGPAAAATPSCGNSCVNTFNQDIGFGFSVDVFRQTEKVGNPIILFRTSNFDPALDWSMAFNGLVSDFLAAGLVSTAVALHYGGLGHFPAPTSGPHAGFCDVANKVPAVNGLCSFPDLPAFEIEYAPFGVNSGLCMGLAATAVSGEGVTLQPCGVSSKTVWIVDSSTALSNDNQVYFPFTFPLINGSDTNFSHPFVLTYPGNAFPTDKPRPQIFVSNLTGFAQPGNGGVLPIIGTVSSAQLWFQTLGTF
jgi:hypothetical protein